MSLDNLENLIESTTISKEWIKNTNAKPTKVALWVTKKDLRVCAIYWSNGKEGIWDDENAMSMTRLIVDLPEEK